MSWLGWGVEHWPVLFTHVTIVAFCTKFDEVISSTPYCTSIPRFRIGIYYIYVCIRISSQK